MISVGGGGVARIPTENNARVARRVETEFRCEDKIIRAGAGVLITDAERVTAERAVNIRSGVHVGYGGRAAGVGRDAVSVGARDAIGEQRPRKIGGIEVARRTVGTAKGLAINGVRLNFVGSQSRKQRNTSGKQLPPIETNDGKHLGHFTRLNDVLHSRVNLGQNNCNYPSGAWALAEAILLNRR